MEYLREDVAPLARLSAPLGSYFVTGNHEYYSNVHPWIHEVKRLGFVVLLNQNHILTRGKGRLLNTMIYVSQGTGYWGPPLRISTRSEITLFELKTV